MTRLTSLNTKHFVLEYLLNTDFQHMKSVFVNSIARLTLIGYQTLWTSLPGVYLSLEKRVSFAYPEHTDFGTETHAHCCRFVLPVTDMLIAILNCCTKEELDEEEEEDLIESEAITPEDESRSCGKCPLIYPLEARLID